MVLRNLPVRTRSKSSLTRAIAGRFGVAVSDKIAFQLVPLIGAIGGAAVNAIFVHHFQEMARGHFTVRRLERKHGQNRVQQAYEKIRKEGVSVSDVPEPEPEKR